MAGKRRPGTGGDAFERGGTQRARGPARARRHRRVGNAGPATAVETRRADAYRADANHAARARGPARPAIVLVARESDARLIGTAPTKRLGAGADALSALADLGRRTRFSAAATIVVIGRRVDAHQRRPAHDPGRPDRCAWNANAAHACFADRADGPAAAAVIVIGRRIDACRARAHTACLLTQGAPAFARYAAASCRAGIAAASAVGVVARRIHARRTLAETAQHLGSGADALAALARRTRRARGSAGPAIPMVGHEVDTPHGGTRPAKRLVCRARTCALLADLTRQAFGVARPTVAEVGLEVYTRGSPARRAHHAVGARAHFRARVGLLGQHRRVRLALKALEPPEVRAPGSAQQERSPEPRDAPRAYHFPRTVSPPPPFDTVPARATPPSLGAVK